jgi:peptidoglycan hydrolase-like protein with peptidoglycan-binding domain
MPPPRRVKRKRGGVSRAEARAEWLARRRGLGGDGAQVLAAAGEARARAESLVSRAPPGDPGSLNWTPLGPSAIWNGQAAGRPVVSGRVLSLAVAPGGTRAYAGVADGGIWRWTSVPQAGGRPPLNRWEPQDDFVVSWSRFPQTSANALSVGDIAVVFGAGPDQDTIFVGTGEAHAPSQGGAAPGTAVRAPYLGVGVRVSLPVVPPDSRKWEKPEAIDLRGEAVFRLAIDPDDNGVIWAATTNGLYRRPAAGGEHWPRVGSGPGLPLPAIVTTDNLITDIRITRAAGIKWIWVAVHDRGVFRSRDNGDGWDPVGGIAAAPGRISLATAPSDPNVIYAFDEQAVLYRIDTAVDAVFRTVQRTPSAPTIFGGQGWYDQMVAVAPDNPNRVFIAGAVTQSARTGDWEWELSAFRGRLTRSGNNWRFGFDATHDSDARANEDDTYIGEGVHGDAHCLTFGRTPAGDPDPSDVWIGCDGGVFRSTASGDRGTFEPLNTGLAAVQITYLDQHPEFDSVVVAGCQDNGVVHHTGHEAWFENPASDGGGMAIDPNHPWRWFAQSFLDRFQRTANAGVEWETVAIPVDPNLERFSFYCQLCTAPITDPPVPAPPAVPNPAGLLVPTNRIWASFDWGTTWVTLPTNTTPGPGNAQDQLDVINPGPNQTVNPIVALAWPTPTTIYAATTMHVFRLDLNPATGLWGQRPLRGPVAPLPPPFSVPLGPITDLAVVDPGTDDIYVSLGGANEHVWWFDSSGSGAWRSTDSLQTNGFNAPAQAIAADPEAPDDIWVGTDVGVFRGQRDTSTTPPEWDYRLRSPGLPEAGVTELRTHVATRRLRAGTHGRGLWELALGTDRGSDPDLYLRMNAADSGRRLPEARAAADPTFIQPDGTRVPVDWADSPDLKVRRGIDAQPDPGYPGRSLRLREPHMKGADVRRWQRHAARRGFTLADDGDFGGISDIAARGLQRRYALTVWNGGEVTDGIVGRQTWAATTSYPPLPGVLDHRAFVQDIREDVDDVTRIQIADATGVNRVFLQLHSRGKTTVDAADLRALLLVAGMNPQGAAPNLPAGWAARVAAGDGSAWPAPWRFVDAANPFRQPAQALTAREPQIVEWRVNFADLGFAAGDTVCLLAFVTTDPGAPVPDVIDSTRVQVQGLVENERRVAARRVRLDAVTAIP